MAEVLKVEGMTCGHCAASVRKAVEGVAPGAKAEVDLARKTVAIEGPHDAQAVRKAITAAGYTVA